MDTISRCRRTAHRATALPGPARGLALLFSLSLTLPLSPATADTKSAPAQECDRLAADPLDADKVAEGVWYDEIDAEKAAQACEQAVASFPGVARFESQLARALVNQKRYAEALTWFGKAEARGYAPAMNALGWINEEGLGVAKDEALAVKWYRKSAEIGDAIGMTSLGSMYDRGHGVAKDEAEAAEWYRKGGEKGDIPAQVALGLMYEEGRGVPKDLSEALRWYRKAAELNDADAIKRLHELGEPVPTLDESDAESTTGTGGLTDEDLEKLD